MPAVIHAGFQSHAFLFHECIQLQFWPKRI